MKYTVGMGSDIMICIPSFIKIDSVIQKLIVGRTQTQTTWRCHKPTFGNQTNIKKEELFRMLIILRLFTKRKKRREGFYLWHFESGNEECGH
jgi:hypothetical protein